MVAFSLNNIQENTPQRHQTLSFGAKASLPKPAFERRRAPGMFFNIVNSSAFTMTSATFALDERLVTDPNLLS